MHKIGEGTFGKVYKADYIQPDGTIKHFALKKMNMILDEQNDQGFPLTSLREIKYLSILDHENVVKLKQVIHSKRKSFISNLFSASQKNKYRGSYYLLFDYMAYDLTGIVDKKVKFSLP